MKLNLPIIAIVFLLCAVGANAQSAKKFYKTAQKFAENANYSDAISNYSKAIDLDPEYASAYYQRALTYEKINEYKKAMLDFERLSDLEPKKADYHYQAARLNFFLKEYEHAIKYATRCIEREKKHYQAYHIRIHSLIALDKLDEALEQADKAINLKSNYGNYYNKAFVLYLKGDFAGAEQSYHNAISEDNNQIDAYVGLAKAYFQQKKYDQSVGTATTGLNINNKSKEAYLIRAKAYKHKIEYQKAINDLSQILVLYPEDKDIADVYLLRGVYYFEFNQHINAINDFNKAIEVNPALYAAYFHRAASYQTIRDYDAAIKDYEQLSTFDLKSDEDKKMLTEALQHLFELKREDDKPILIFENPVIRNEGELEFVKGEKQGRLIGEVKDLSEVKSFTVNGNRVMFDEGTRKNLFETQITLGEEVKEIEIVAVDVYENTLRETYAIVYTEKDAPEVMMVVPMASDDGQIYLDTEDPSIFIQGTIMDESKIASIKIDGVLASYIPDNLNPTFTATINVQNKSKIVVTAEDVFGNKKEQIFLINREAAALAASNPMGKTWVIFLENSKYETFASLDGPTKDVTMMKSALAKYQIHNVIHKKDMSKAEMERFFSIELRDLVKKNRVNSVVVWYAGHGKFINNTGYWIPVDAKRDDEFTYFNISSLKASMQSYSEIITHTLVITDACESGPTFYQAMRSTLEVRDCSDFKATKFKSSQVFSSAGYELASDNSQFTKTFAATLIHNPNACIPIESIVSSVTEAVAKNNQQKPQFGKIDGLKDENGTFFFIKK